MGTLNYTVGYYSKFGGVGGSGPVMSTKIITSDAFTTSTSAANVTDGSGAITAQPGQVFACVADEPMWIAFGGTTATVGNDLYLPADTLMHLEVYTAGNVSVIDVS